MTFELYHCRPLSPSDLISRNTKMMIHNILFMRKYFRQLDRSKKKYFLLTSSQIQLVLSIAIPNTPLPPQLHQENRIPGIGCIYTSDLSDLAYTSPHLRLTAQSERFMEPALFFALTPLVFGLTEKMSIAYLLFLNGFSFSFYPSFRTFPLCETTCVQVPVI